MTQQPRKNDANKKQGFGQRFRKFFSNANPSPRDPTKQAYFQLIHYQHRNFDVKGLTTQGVYTLELEKVFVHLALAPQTRGKRVSADPLRAVPQNLKEGRHDSWAFLTDKQMAGRHLAILGAPGSGKTTLLKYITLRLAREDAEQPEQLYTPILLFLRDHATEIGKNPAFSLLDAIQSRLAVWQKEIEQEIKSEWFEAILNRGDALIMLDGLDEVADEETRRLVVKWVEQQMSRYGKNRFVVTSRPFGYYDNPLQQVTVLEVRPFTITQVKQFVHNWYLANEIMSAQRDDPGVRMQAKGWAEDLLDRLNQLPVLLEMAVNPLLLTMIATVHRYRSSLPGRRVELYSEICEVFLGKRQMAKGMRIDLTPAQKQRVLQQLAFNMMVKNQREIRFEDAAQVIERPLRLVQGLQEDGGNDSEDFLAGIENGSGLLIERESGVYSFAHLTFQEYLAAVHVMDQQLEKELVKHVENSWWHETIRLYAAQSDATNIIKACLSRRLPSVPALTLAMECLEEAREVRPELRTIFQKIVNSVDHYSPEVRQTAAEVFLMLRLRRFVRIDEAKYVDTTLISNSEYQLFLEYGRSQRNYFQPDHWRSYTYENGNGRKPVVGIRPSDAEAFCAWLTERDNTGWVFRLPRANELNLSRLRSDGHVTDMENATYWYVNNGSYQTANFQTEQDDAAAVAQLQQRFLKEWELHNKSAGNTQIKQKVGQLMLARAQQRQFVMKNLDRNLSRELKSVPHILQDFNYVRDRSLEDVATDLDLAINDALAIVNDPNVMAARHIELDTIITLTKALGNDIKKAGNLNLPQNMLGELQKTIERVRSLTANRDSMNFMGLDQSLNRALMIVREISSVIAREKVNTRHRLSANLLQQLAQLVQERSQGNGDKKLLATILDLYIDIMLLEERLADAIPALEGIRVVRVKV